jgi:ribonuclease P protein component
MAVDGRFTARHRLRRRSEFQRVYDRGAKVHGRFLTLFALPNQRDVSRLGIAATRKLGGAVQRNLAKRRVREVFRTHRPKESLDVVVVPKREFFQASFPALIDDFQTCLRRRTSAHAGSRSSRPRR